MKKPYRAPRPLTHHFFCILGRAKVYQDKGKRKAEEGPAADEVEGSTEATEGRVEGSTAAPEDASKAEASEGMGKQTGDGRATASGSTGKANEERSTKRSTALRQKKAQGAEGSVSGPTNMAGAGAGDGPELSAPCSTAPSSSCVSGAVHDMPPPPESSLFDVGFRVRLV